ncbi:MAG: TraB/GumN family protein [Chloroflexota bacterium]
MADAGNRKFSTFCATRKASHVASLCLALIAVVGWIAAWRPVEAQEKSLLWKVSKSEKSIFLLGSIHYLRQDNYPLNPDILSAFAASKKLVLEIDLNGSAGAAAQKATLEKAQYGDGTNLARNVSEETYRLAAQRATALGLDMRILNPMKPWFVALTMLAINLQRLGFDPKFGVDRYLAARAKEAGKPTSGLETVEFQLGLFDQLSKEEQESMLRETVGEIDRLDKNINDIVQAWIKGDGDRLADLLLAGMQEYPELEQKIISERNRRWLAEFERLIQQESGAMVVVGAAHLVGKEGIVAMLQARGYTVEQK